jgi:crotonobetainyl-CoA:carnitine CoA-transferase CaiB-like acyl-CoA transferase
MLADQGAEVHVERPAPSHDLDGACFDRGKTRLPAGALAERLEPIVANRTAREWEVLLDAHDIPNTKILTLREWLTDPHATSRR